MTELETYELVLTILALITWNIIVWVVLLHVRLADQRSRLEGQAEDVRKLREELWKTRSELRTERWDGERRLAEAIGEIRTR